MPSFWSYTVLAFLLPKPRDQNPTQSLPDVYNVLLLRLRHIFPLPSLYRIELTTTLQASQNPSIIVLSAKPNTTLLGLPWSVFVWWVRVNVRFYIESWVQRARRREILGSGVERAKCPQKYHQSSKSSTIYTGEGKGKIKSLRCDIQVCTQLKPIRHFFCSPGTHHWWLNKGSMKWDVCLTLLHTSFSRLFEVYWLMTYILGMICTACGTPLRPPVRIKPKTFRSQVQHRTLVATCSHC